MLTMMITMLVTKYNSSGLFNFIQISSTSNKFSKDYNNSREEKKLETRGNLTYKYFRMNETREGEN